MNATFKIAVVAALALAVAIGVIGLRPATYVGGPDPSPSPTAEPARLPEGELAAGTYVAMPFAAPGSGACYAPPQPGCSDPVVDDDIRFTLTVPDGLEALADSSVGPPPLDERNTPTWAAILFERGAWLYPDPCTSPEVAEMIPVGQTAAEFADALVAHPWLDVTNPVDVTLGGYSGKYLELRVPLDLAVCDDYRPWEPGIFAHGPGELWRLWVLDVDGLRVIVREMTHEGTTPEVRAKLQGVIDSIAIEPATAPVASPSPAPLVWSLASAEQDWPAPIRADPAGDPVLAPLAGGYTDPSGDIESPDMPWIDIQAVRNCYSICIELGALPPSPLAGSNGPWIVYGLVYDTDYDGVADIRLGMDIMPPPPSTRVDRSNTHVWSTDLHTGQTESVYDQDRAPRSEYLCECFYPGGLPGSGSGAATARIDGRQIPGRFYAWASVIQDGRVVATDYAPDSGWIAPAASPPDQPTAAPTQ